METVEGSIPIRQMLIHKLLSFPFFYDKASLIYHLIGFTYQPEEEKKSIKKCFTTK